MDKLRNTGLACVAWLWVAASAAGTAAAQAQAPAKDSYASEVPASENSIGTDLTGKSSDGSIPVAAETAFVLRNKYRKQGGYDENLKRVTGIEYYGTRYVDCEHHPVEIRVARPDAVAVRVKGAASSALDVRKSGKDIVIRGTSRGIPREDERALLETFDFDTPIVDLQKKHPALRPVGMQKIPHILAWKFEGERAGEYYRVLYVDAHSGDVVRYTVMKVGGVPLLDVALHDYRIVKGIRVPFAIDYREPNGTLLASDRFERVAVTQR